MSGSINTGGGNVIINVRVNNQQAATAFGQIQGHLSSLRTYTTALELEFRNLDRTLRYMAAGAVVALTGSLVNLAGELERQTVLMATLEGTMDRANNRMDQLVSLAQKVPFSLSVISDSFVKLRTAGIDPIINAQGDGPLRNLLDAVAAFGGTDQQLQRATVAIQQMAGKSVVSLEELRQQLGEAVPTAIQSMASGMGISIAELIERISKGNVTFREGVNAMLAEFQRNYRGAGELLNNTFFGSIRQLKTELDSLVLSFNRAGGLDIFTVAIQAITGALRDVNATLTSSTIKQAFDDFTGWVTANSLQIGHFFNVIMQFGSALATLAGFIGMVVSSMPADALAGGILGWIMFGRAGFVVGAILGTFNESIEGFLSGTVALMSGLASSGGIIGAGAAELATMGAIGFLLLGRTGFVIAGLFALADSVVGLFRNMIAQMSASAVGAWEFLKSQFTLGFTSPLTPLENWRESSRRAIEAENAWMKEHTGKGTGFGDINKTPFGEWISDFNSQSAANARESASAVEKIVERLRAMREQVAANREAFNNRFGQPNALGGPSQSDIDAIESFNKALQGVMDRKEGAAGAAVDSWARRMKRVGDTFQETIDRMELSRLQALDEGRPADADNLQKNITKSREQLAQFRATVDEVSKIEHGKIVSAGNAQLDKFQATMRALKEEVNAFSAANESGRRSEDAEVARVQQRYEQIQSRMEKMRVDIERSKGSDAEQSESLRTLNELQVQLNASREKAIEIARRKAQWEQEDAQRTAQRGVQDAALQLRREQLGLAPGSDYQEGILQRQAALRNSIQNTDDQIRILERRMAESGGADQWTQQWIERLRQIREGFEKLYDQVGTFSEREAKRGKELFDGIGRAAEDSFARGLEVLITGTGTLKDVWNSFFQDISRSVSRYITNMIFQEAGAAGGTGTGGLLMKGFTAIAGMFGGGATGAAAANGLAFNNGQIQRFATGGAFTNRVVSGPTLFNIGQMGEAGPEAIMPLARIGGRLGVAASASGDKYAISITALDAASVRELFYREGGALVGSLQQRTRLNRGLR